MKAIIIDNKIISLENILTVELCTFRTGAKSNPYYYNLLFHYTNDKEVFTERFNEKETAQGWFEKVFEILSKNA